jgi:aspartyl-tRNA(Asn)/glutamyl-tRNA(Gln) amidotransferase subunit A
VLRIPDGALNPEVERSYSVFIDRLIELGYSVKEIDMETLDYVVPAYYTIATAEASANLARYTGIRYGYRSGKGRTSGELMEKTRDDGFGDEVKLRILLGTYVLRSGFQDQFYHRAQKIRTAIKNEFDDLFRESDLVMMPVYPAPAFKHGESELDPFQQKVADKYTCTANLTGFPAITVPSTVENGLPVGVQFMAPAFEEERLFTIAEETEKIFPSPDAPVYSLPWS